MRILVITPTRGRPANAVTLSNVIAKTMSGEHDVVHCLSCDDDDVPLPLELFPSIAKEIRKPRADSLGEAWNAPIGRLSNWDICTFIGDDVLPMTPGWDKGIVAICARHEVAAWTETNYPHAATYPIMTKRFCDAMAGEPYTGWFPFWFDDPWLNEVVTFAFGRGIPIVTDLNLYSREHGITNGMRDLAFWVDFFIAARQARIARGRLLAAAYGKQAPDPASALALFESTDAMWPDRIPRIEKANGVDNSRPMTARYQRAKARAQEWMTNRIAA